MSDKTSSPRVQKTRQRLLEAAGEQLMLKGYAGATTRSIAEAAGVSELTLFRHFPSKKDLFSALFETYSPKANLQTTLAGMLTGDLRQDLTIIGKQSLTSILERRQAILLTLSETEGLEELHDIVAALPRQGRQMLAAYLKTQMDNGRLRRRDPLLAAQAFFGMFLAYMINQSMLKEPTGDPDSIVAAFVDIFLDGMLAPANPK